MAKRNYFGENDYSADEWETEFESKRDKTRGMREARKQKQSRKDSFYNTTIEASDEDWD